MDLDDLVRDITESYSKTTLLALLTFLGDNPDSNGRKDDIVLSLISAFDSDKAYNFLIRLLSKEAEIVLKHLVWEGISTLSKIDSINHIKSSIDDFCGNSSDPFIQIFKNYHNREIFLSTGLRYLFKKYISMPVIDKTPLDGENLTTDNFVIENLEAIREFILFERVGERPLNKNLLKKSISKFRAEFSLDSDFDDLRITIILRFLSYLSQNGDPLNELKNLVTQYKIGNMTYENIDSFLFYPNIKGCGTNPNLGIFLKRGRLSFINRIISDKSDTWIDIGSLVREQSLKEDTQIFDTTYFGSLLSIKTVPSRDNFFLDSMELIYKEDNEEFLLKPMLVGISYFLYSIGGADLIIKETIPTHIKLTELGKKLFGLPSTFKLTTATGFSYTFNEKRLIIHIKGRDAAKENFFKRIGKQAGSEIYIITPVDFIKECSSEEDLYHNIDTLKKLLPDSVPEIWRHFISDMEERIYPLYNEQELIVVNFPRDDMEFIETIMDNSRIRALFSMVEGFKGAFSRSDYSKFKKLMKEEGYLI